MIIIMIIIMLRCIAVSSSSFQTLMCIPVTYTDSSFEMMPDLSTTLRIRFEFILAYSGFHFSSIIFNNLVESLKNVLKVCFFTDMKMYYLYLSCTAGANSSRCCRTRSRCCLSFIFKKARSQQNKV